jgi:hypothetical protein
LDEAPTSFEYDEADVDEYGGDWEGYEPEPDPEMCERMWFDGLACELTDEEIFARHGDEIRARYPEDELDSPEALREWIAWAREESSYPQGPLTLEQQAEELNRCADMAAGPHSCAANPYVVVGDQIVAKGTKRHAELLEQQRQELAWNRIQELRQRRDPDLLRALAELLRAAHRGSTRAPGRSSRVRSTSAAGRDGPEPDPDADRVAATWQVAA